MYCQPSKLSLRRYNPTSLLRPPLSVVRAEISELPGPDFQLNQDNFLIYLPEDPTLGYVYRKPRPEVTPHWSQWPEPTNRKRAHTSLGFAYDNEVDDETPPTYFWQNSSDYETMNLGKSTVADRTTVVMNRGLSPRRAVPRNMQEATALARFEAMQRARNRPNGLDLDESTYNKNRGFSQGFTSYSMRESRPAYRQVQRAPKGEEQVHKHSVFYSTTPLVSGHFIIHPDWVSERQSLRRSKSLLSF